MTIPGIEIGLDRRRVRSFIGLVLGRLGPRAHGAVSMTFLILLVGEHTKSLLMVTLALTASRFVTWAIYPLAGRLSDRSDTILGRRVPFMVGGLLLMGGCTALYTRAGSYWSLLILIMIARVAYTIYNLTSTAVTPETFGGSRWLRAGVAVTVGGLIVGASIRVTVIATWVQSDRSTWGAAYYLAAGYIVFAGLAIALLVREVPKAQRVRRPEHDFSVRETWHAMASAPNAQILLAGVLLANAAGGAFDRVYPIWARDELGSGGAELAGAALATTVLTIATLPLAWWLAGKMPLKALPVLAGLTGAAGAFAHLWVTALWQSVAIGVFSQVFLVAAVIALVPMYLRIFPRIGGLAQRLGVVLAPVVVSSMLASYVSALLFDVILSDWSVVWIFTGALSLGAGFVYSFMRVPPWATHADPGAMWRNMREILWGARRSRPLFRGELAPGDADGTALLEAVQDALDPYAPPAAPGL